MGDKMRKVIPLRITFGAGEQPPNSKLNAISEQVRNGIDLIEKAIGDPWGQSGDSIYSSIPLQTSNLARALGEMRYLNPSIFPVDGEFTITEKPSSRGYTGDNEGHLVLIPSSGSLGYSGTSPFVTKVSKPSVNSTGEYAIDITNGKFYAFDHILTNSILSYYTTAENWTIKQDMLPGIIPDPRQESFTGCRISKDGDQFFLHLPPRQPLTIDLIDQAFPMLTSGEFSLNVDTAPIGTSARKLWQDSSVDAFTGTDAAWYRYTLPEALQGLDPGTIIPANSLYLWSQANNTIIEDIQFQIPASGNNGYTLELVTSTQEDFLDTCVTSGESSSDYGVSELSIITVGNSIAQSINTLFSTMLRHSHRGVVKASRLNSSLETPADHYSLGYLNPPRGGGPVGSMPSYLPLWPMSYWGYGDVHTSLLSRGGSHAGPLDTRDKYNNAMLGDFVLANADTSGAENFLDPDCPDKSFKLCFGDIDGLSFYAADSSMVTIEGSAETGLRILDQGDDASIYLLTSGNDAWIAFSDNFLGNGETGLDDLNIIGQDKVGLFIGDGYGTEYFSVDVRNVNIHSYSLLTPTKLTFFKDSGETADKAYITGALGVLNLYAPRGVVYNYGVSGVMLRGDSTNILDLRAGDDTRWNLTTAGNFVPYDHNTYTIGTSDNYLNTLFTKKVNLHSSRGSFIYADDTDTTIWFSDYPNENFITYNHGTENVTLQTANKFIINTISGIQVQINDISKWNITQSILPVTSGTNDIGSSSLRLNNLYSISGNFSGDSLDYLVKVENFSTDSNSRGIFSEAAGGIACYGGSDSGVGIQGSANHGLGVKGISTPTVSGILYAGVYGEAFGEGIGIKGYSVSGYAGYFDKPSAISGYPTIHIEPTTEPVSGLRMEGDLYVDKDNHHLYYFNGSDWIQLD